MMYHKKGILVHLLQYWLHLSEITDTDTRENVR